MSLKFGLLFCAVVAVTYARPQQANDVIPLERETDYRPLNFDLKERKYDKVLPTLSEDLVPPQSKDKVKQKYNTYNGAYYDSDADYLREMKPPAIPEPCPPGFILSWTVCVPE